MEFAIKFPLLDMIKQLSYTRKVFGTSGMHAHFHLFFGEKSSFMGNLQRGDSFGSDGSDDVTAQLAIYCGQIDWRIQWSRGTPSDLVGVLVLAES